jgi:type IV pilus assembly protein PilV
MNQNRMYPLRSRPHDGFTLLEVLVALLVLSIGLLGIGKMMMLSARANDSAYMRSQATALGYTILDAMRANRQSATVSGYDTALGVFPAAAPGCGTSVAAACNSGQQAQYDLWQWGTSLAAQLPGGVGSVATVVAPDILTGANNITATVTVQWSDKVGEQSFGTPSAVTATCAVGGCVSITLETVL